MKLFILFYPLRSILIKNILFIYLIISASVSSAGGTKDFENIVSLNDCIIATKENIPSKWHNIPTESLSAKSAITFPGVFVPEGYTFENAPVIIYIQAVQKKNNDSFDKYIRKNLQENSKMSDFPTFKQDSSHIAKLFIPHNKNEDPYVIVYANHKKHFLHFILSGKTLDLLKTNKNSLEELINNTKYAYYVSSKEEGDKNVYLYETEQNEHINFNILKSHDN